VKDRFWRECEWENVVMGTLLPVLRRHLPEGEPPEVWKRITADVVADFSDEFARAGASADIDSMTRQQELEHNARIFAEAITSVCGRRGWDPAEFTDRYGKIDTLFNVHGTLSALPAPAGR